MAINTENKNHFIYIEEDIQIGVLGGLNDSNLSQLHVTLKVNKVDNYNAIRHNINLYNGTQVEKFIRKVSEELQIRFLTVRKSIINLTEELEDYRLQTIGGTEQETESYLVSEEDQEEAMDLLTSEDLFARTSDLIGASGIVDEDNNRLLMYLIFTSRKTNNPLHCISFGQSGSGKTHLQSKVAELIPAEDKVEITQLSANAFYYYKQHELKNKLVIIEDLDGAIEGLLPLRELQTKKRITKSVVQKGIGGIGKTQNLIVEGPVCVSGCTTKESIYEDNSNRSFLLYVDESNAQDERIMEYQRLGFAGKINVTEQLKSAKLLRNVQRLLTEVSIRNPYAEYLKLPSSVFKPRRTNIHYLQLIEIITFYHQYQRELVYDKETGEEYLETTIEDIQMANTLIADTLLRKSDRLTKVTRDYLEDLTAYLKPKKKTIYSNSEVRKELHIDETTLRRYHKKLIAEGYIKKRTDIKGVSNSYEVLEMDEFKNLQQTIQNALDFCLQKFVTSAVPRHSKSDEPKPNNNNEFTETRH